jgi:hypothetical protein
MEFDIGLQTLVRRWAGLEREDPDIPAFFIKEDRRHADVGAHVEHAVSIVQLNAVLQVATRPEHFTVDETRLTRVQGEYVQTIGENQPVQNRLLSRDG